MHRQRRVPKVKESQAISFELRTNRALVGIPAVVCVAALFCTLFAKMTHLRCKT